MINEGAEGKSDLTARERKLFRPAKRSRGRPQKTAAILAAHRLRAWDRTLRQIAESDEMKSLCGGRVSEARVSQLLRSRPRGLAPWRLDVAQVDQWCAGTNPDPEFYRAKIAPLLFAHPGLHDVGTRRTPVGSELFGDVVAGRVRWSRDGIAWRARFPDLMKEEALAEQFTRRTWRLEVRNRLIRYLWGRGQDRDRVPRGLRENLGRRFGLSERQIYRVIAELDRPSQAGTAGNGSLP